MSKLTGKRIFITEDDTLNRMVYKMILGKAGAVTDFDRWGKETIWRIKVFNPELIILDLMLPIGTSGFEVFSEIRKLPDFTHIPIVAISAAEPAFVLPKCQELGFSGFIAKPIEEELLPDQLLRLIEGDQVWYLGERYGGEAKLKR
jgi:CheY-like chemotaxis protein